MAVGVLRRRDRRAGPTILEVAVATLTTSTPDHHTRVSDEAAFQFLVDLLWPILQRGWCRW